LAAGDLRGDDFGRDSGSADSLLTPTLERIDPLSGDHILANIALVALRAIACWPADGQLPRRAPAGWPSSEQRGLVAGNLDDCFRRSRLIY
jgi:hypothetical protein